MDITQLDSLLLNFKYGKRNIFIDFDLSIIAQDRANFGG